MSSKLAAFLVSTACLVQLLGAAPAAASVACVTGPVVQWAPAAGGNGHFYQAVCSQGTWTQANAAAIASGHHLATITSSEENAFVFDLVDNQEFWVLSNCNAGPWLGGFQPPGSAEPSQGWLWVTGETFSFAPWHDGEPNNYNGSEEDHVGFFNCAGGATRSAHWSDRLDSSPHPGYVAEWEHSLDVDLDGETDALTDGILVLRRLFGFTGTAITNGAVDTNNCKRCDAPAITSFLDLIKGGTVHDAAADWSEAANPNGPWSYREATDLLPHVAWWQSGLGGYTAAQPGWASSENGNNRIPFFHKSLGFENFAHDYLTGDVVVHTWDATNGVGNGDARLRFTVPSTGIYRLALAVWMGREIGRTVDWELVHDATQLDSGTVASGDGFSRSSPDGTAQSRLLEAGDVVDLQLLTTGVGFGDFVGLKLRFESFGIDVDGDGEVQALTDGLLILRRLFGFTGPALVSGVVDLTNCTRCDGTAITAFLDAID